LDAVVVAAVLVGSFGLTVIGIRGRAMRRTGRAPAAARVRRGVARQRRAMNYLITLFIYQFGLNAIVPYLVLFIRMVTVATVRG
jgi:hypothetical protein